jgi:hypothetical protein
MIALLRESELNMGASCQLVIALLELLLAVEPDIELVWALVDAGNLLEVCPRELRPIVVEKRLATLEGARVAEHLDSTYTRDQELGNVHQVDLLRHQN